MEAQGCEDTPGHDPYGALRFPAYRRFVAGHMSAVIGQEMLSVAVGWQLFGLTGSATALGLVGLVQVVAVLSLALPAGQLADRFNRKVIVLLAQSLMGTCTLAMTLVWLNEDFFTGSSLLQALNGHLQSIAAFWGEPDATFTHPAIPLVYGLLLCMGVARAVATPARAALLPRIIPAWVFSNAVAWHTSAFQVAAVAGPALGGSLLALFDSSTQGFAVVYSICFFCVMTQFFLLWSIDYTPEKRSPGAVGWKGLTAATRFVWQTKAILATITLDMFAVLLGGATALLPLFAKERLDLGAAGLGCLRAAPALGAFTMAMLIAHHPPLQRPGAALLWAVTGFGAATIVFGLSRSFGLSLAMLFLTGAFDNISVVVRHTLVQTLTPDAMRGRVSAVNTIFISLSNEMGALESGLTAALFGPVLSVVGGGVGTIVAVLAAALTWPQIRHLGPLAGLRPARTVSSA
jgi:MFS family permease